MLGNARAQADAMLPVHQRMMRALEAAGHLDRAIEFLPNDHDIEALQASGAGLSSPELAVLSAYVKLALTEELATEGGIVRDLGFGGYRIPTMMDAAAVPTIVLELGNPDAPYGLRGVGEMPSISSTPAVLAALRAATGRALVRVPVRPEDLAG
jgi:hypothetical protein